MCLVRLIIIVVLAVTVTVTVGINFFVALGVLLILGTKTGRSGMRAIVGIISGDKKSHKQSKERELKQTVVDITTVGRNILDSAIESTKQEVADYKEFKAMKKTKVKENLDKEVFNIEDEPYNNL